MRHGRGMLPPRSTSTLPPPDPDSGETPLRDVAAVARRLGVSVKTVRRMVARGDLAAVRVGRSLRIMDADLESYIAAQRSAPAAP